MAAFYAVWQLVCGWIGSPTYHLWFVPMIICMYLVTPLLRMWVNGQNIRSVEWFLKIAFVLLFVIPQITELAIRGTGGNGFLRGFLDDLNVAYSVRYVVYFILGWYLNRGVRHWKLVCWLGLFGLCMTFAGTWAAKSLLGMDTYPFYRNFTVNVLLHSAAIFVLCRMRFAQPVKQNGMAWKVVRWTGKCSLGIYAVHLYVISKLMPIFGSMHIFVALPLIFVLTLALSATVSMVFQRIPMIREIV